MVSSASQITTAMQTAQPGDTLIMTNGTWTNQQISFGGFGNSTNPITLRAETPGQVILNGNSTLDITGSWLVADGLRFEGGALANGSSAIVEFRGSKGEATNSRLTNSAIIGYNPASVDDRYHWVEIFGQNNRVDHNRFENQNHSGVTVVVRRDDTGADNHLIDANHFVDRPVPNNPSDPNGFETIRVGTSDESLSDSFTTVENNLFERLDGEIEIISNKSGQNTYRYNTFRDSKGTLTLRHGNDTLVEGNFFLGGDTNNSGAIRVIGERQTIVNNYIANVDDRAGGAISISAGVPNSALNQYYQVKDAVIAHNTLVNTQGVMLTFDDGLGSSGRTLKAENVTVANNIFRSDGPTIFEGSEGTGWTWEGNIAFGGSLGPKAGAAGITAVDPQLQIDPDGLWRLSSTSPAINSGTGSYGGLIANDMDGQARIGIFDIGADEFSMAQIVRKPLAAADVGPSWLGPDEPPVGGGGGGCFARGCSIQAEDFAAILDPNNNGLFYTTVDDTDALGGKAIRAPGGNTYTQSGPQDTIAVYDMEFQQAGTYRAYYRAKGFNGSSDSLYVPNNFNIDPTVQENTSNDSTYVWEVGNTFTISPSNVGVPLEFRIGKREGSNQLDALVLDLDLSLTPAELDALFAPVFDPGDFNEDGFVDGNDLLSWQTGYGTPNSASHLDGDADEDGDVDGNDFLIWQRGYTGPAPLASQTVAVPERSGMTLCLIGLLVSAVCTRSGNSLQPFIRSILSHAS
ncbi:polysaccharide lyase 6 family protein [Bythopirellula polymerisocia]|nr:polysaccharide lyase 6 family protein [Bythopirellula polymerisocia]